MCGADIVFDGTAGDVRRHSGEDAAHGSEEADGGHHKDFLHSTGTAGRDFRLHILILGAESNGPGALDTRALYFLVTIVLGLVGTGDVEVEVRSLLL